MMLTKTVVLTVIVMGAKGPLFLEETDHRTWDSCHAAEHQINTRRARVAKQPVRSLRLSEIAEHNRSRLQAYCHAK